MLPALAEQRWHLPEALPQQEGWEAELNLQGQPLPDSLVALLWRRGFRQAKAIAELLDPPAAPAAKRHFPDLAVAIQRLQLACSSGERLAICGDYDADGMTSTALLVGVLQRLGAQPVAAIPSRMEEGYGLNAAMVERLAGEGIRLLVTVDNGVSALEALERAQALGVEVILTDHHTLPDPLPPHLALLHPECTPAKSPYRGLAGVGLAYVLAASLCQSLKRKDGLQVASHLYCIGTIADMAPLVGVNRRWLMDGLPQLAQSPLAGLQALQQVAGLEEKQLDAQAVGFQIAPRINAVGRLGDPQLVVELLTTEDPNQAMALARECEALNRQRRDLCSAIEAEAMALLEADGPARTPFLLLAQNHWHHGVIGIVAARLSERFGRPAALLAGEGNGRLRASVRAPRGFAVDKALQACAPLLERFGGHPAAGGFTVKAESVAALHEQLNGLAGLWLQESGAGLPIEPEALLDFEAIDRDFYRQLQRLEPFGIGHPQPLFWSAGCRLVSQRLLRGGHLQLELAQGERTIRAMGWGWQGQADLPALLDVAFRLRLDNWQGQERFQLELAGVKASSGWEGTPELVLRRGAHTYWCSRQGQGWVVRNASGQEISPESAGDQPHPYVNSLLQEAAMALGLVA
ncbi:single-stranded-DNA-specific exonuclease RecJ [Cyanobium sp. HWJ4-Hawea]|uniref:single-stranded-DNA-specific exonuclease RecJ n=1 Tax=Cyanobium sp. HWJ4-Hawea TaxID=2823713 RepID=UPI0039657BCD|nr:single-stranded-DNA-specific exonuclease RecJ [Cyanobium sp. HWJ4-Hawea]